MALLPGMRLGAYEVQAPLGVGGMGEVYRVRDTRLQRDVAIKVLPEAFASDPERLARFEREAQVLASLNHPHIAQIYGFEAGALVMELVGGETLADRLARGPMPLADTVEIGQQIATALAAAHDQGIVHRDLKPDNIRITPAGVVKVLDFGLAKVQGAVAGAPHDARTYVTTGAGMVLGTPAYMSPEQVSGADVDHRTDIFSLGVVLYEMATGERPFKGQSAADLSAAILRDAPPSAADVRPAVPRGLATTIARCLQKEISTRFATMAQVGEALAGTSRSAAPATPSIAVLPFQNLSADPDNEFFGDGLAEEILNALAQIEGLRVAARTSAFSFKGQAVDVAAVGARLKVATVLEGSVRRAGTRLRVTVQLVDVANGFQLWSERYDRQMADVFDVQDEIARAIADRLKVTLVGAESSRLVKRVTGNVEAYDLLLRGRAVLLKRGRSVVEAADCFRRAVELDPRFAAAWAALADAYTVSGYYGTAPPAETMPKALTAARRAVTLDPDNADAHCALAMALLLWERDYAGADAAFRRCLDLNPQNTQGRCWHALFNLEWVQGRVDAAVTEARRALEGDPLSAYAHAILALTLGSAGQTAEALGMARVATERQPDALLTQWIHGLVAHWHGDFEESEIAFRAAAQVSGRHPFAVGHCAVMYADWGKAAEARALFDEMESTCARGGYICGTTRAIAASAVGERDLAFDLVSQACDEREPLLILVARMFPDVRRLRDDPRFGDVVRRLVLPPWPADRPVPA